MSPAEADQANPSPSAGLLTPATGVGWYGKIPAAGDFVSRRLPQTFIGPWDQWLQNGLSESRRRLGERWVDVYLTFPVWRFLLPCGVLGPSGWTGVLMPSVDRVGRFFPLTLACSLNHSDFIDLSLSDLEAFLAPMEETGLQGLDGEPVDPFDLRVRSLAHHPAGHSTGLPSLVELQDETTVGQWRCDLPVDRALGQGAGQQLLSFLGRRTIWWLSGAEASGGTIRLDRWPMANDAFDLMILQD